MSASSSTTPIGFRNGENGLYHGPQSVTSTSWAAPRKVSPVRYDANRVALDQQAEARVATSSNSGQVQVQMPRPPQALPPSKVVVHTGSAQHLKKNLHFASASVTALFQAQKGLKATHIRESGRDNGASSSDITQAYVDMATLAEANQAKRDQQTDLRKINGEEEKRKEIAVAKRKLKDAEKALKLLL